MPPDLPKADFVSRFALKELCQATLYAYNKRQKLVFLPKHQVRIQEFLVGGGM